VHTTSASHVVYLMQGFETAPYTAWKEESSMRTTRTPLQQAMAEWTRLFGAERCIAGTDVRAQAYGHDVSEYARRVIAAIVYPTSPGEVQAIVRVANTHNIPLYSLSIGKNWGLGSRQPVKHHGVVVDLSRMRKIRTINLDEGYAIVEPGVTQQALSDALAPTGYIANYTTSTPETSLVGNVLDKGIGLYRHRVEDLLGVEVVTGAGDLLHVGGFWPMGQEIFAFTSGLGPTLTPLFLQSNFGIVTAGVLKLVPRPETVHMLYATLSADQLPQALAVLKQLRAEQVINTIIKLYNAYAFHTYNGTQASPLIAALYGSTAWVHHVSPFVTDTLHQAHCFDDVTILDPGGLTRAPQVLQALSCIFAGMPTSFAVQKALALPNDEASQHVDLVAPKGLLFIIPVVPLTNAAIRCTLDTFSQAATQYHLPINTTLNILSDSAVEMVSSIVFARTPESTRQAHDCKQHLIAALRQHGIPLMRLDIDAQDDPQLFLQMPYQEVLIQLKQLFDPHAIIAPGRYLPQARVQTPL
jgi:4-cresol dehydrogenase (hydroxylating)